MGTFKDDRGVIEDLLQCRLDGVTRIFTRKGAVRGNHVHRRTQQWTYVVSGSLRTVLQISHGNAVHTLRRAGDLFLEPAGVPHAWQAEEDTLVLVFTAGPRTGDAYESDTARLEVPLL